MEVRSDVTVPGVGRLKTSPAMCNQIRDARKDKYSPTMETVTHLPEVKEGKCFFPFRYRDGIFHDCVQFRVKHKWCSLNETYQGYWKYCSEEDFAKCVFPFWYRHLIYWGCTEDGDSFGKAWCSLTRNYNKDRVWKYCD
ncbi:binder of sperm protein homolog 1 isoform X2 [Bos indicus]|uniref:Fibronectin type-II domain-containing protein n=4 Tax=Bos TaxID=9903 RepID=A0AAA9SYH5_BOVIN|nr:binder of sperm protein homolog 1 isoform X1 [Bos taurus]XP_024834958.1 binder of sperm protein homolog 1 isoform X1 [Bos taurus]XP_027371102.1 binder of sperm protein homolog 1 isoform X1 [Bos indicus x Bos taurus]XP_027371103.1 binder of sperm protein homolog 1 isoform X1 [Bos indicus x Bos taurus]XP_027371104.1 binder of sperm protein homolog 1 isoform X1 [Bos indicus x Bos taurus]